MQLPLLETDQTRCYDSAGIRIECRGTDQDAALPKRLTHGASRFQARGGCVLDTFTNALWCQNANPAEFPLTWEEARAIAADMAARKAFGQENWQLPSRRLLFSLISHQHVNPALPEGHPFENVFSGNCWTADTCSRLPDQAWHIHLGGGRIPHANKQDSCLLWPVCPPRAESGAIQAASARFVIENRAVRDRLTGLLWLRDADPFNRPLSWQEALTAAKRFNETAVCGHLDWRMPNIRELESLVDLCADSPALAPDHPFGNVREVYWSSTTSVYEPRYAWALYTRDGMVGVGFKPDAVFHLWPVRG